MRFPASTLLALAGAASTVASTAAAASSWTFSDGTVTVSSKAAADVVDKVTGAEPVKKMVLLGHGDQLKLELTTKEGSKAKRPHQAFLMLKEESGLEAPIPLHVKESGKASVKISHKDLPIQMRLARQPLRASLVLASFGSAVQGSMTPVFNVKLKGDLNGPTPFYEAPLRYGPLPEIHHEFGNGPKSPPKIVSLFFSLAILATVPALYVGWLLLGANVNHAPAALGSSPASHVVFLGSVVAMEGVFFLYYSRWNLFQALPLIGIVGAAAFLSGTKALGEVQRRRLDGPEVRRAAGGRNGS